MMVEMARLKTINAELELQKFDLQSNKTYESNPSSSLPDGSCLMVCGDGSTAMHDSDQFNRVGGFRKKL